MKASWNRWLIILFCALFNLCFEYSARGITQFVTRPPFVLSLFGIYLIYFATLEELIVRYHPANYHLFPVAFLYGLLPTALLAGNLFNRRIYWGVVVAGVNVETVFIIGIPARGAVQRMIALYLANRLSPRDWDHPRMVPIGWAAGNCQSPALIRAPVRRVLGSPNGSDRTRIACDCRSSKTRQHCHGNVP